MFCIIRVFESKRTCDKYLISTNSFSLNTSQLELNVQGRLPTTKTEQRDEAVQHKQTEQISRSFEATRKEAKIAGHKSRTRVDRSRIWLYSVGIFGPAPHKINECNIVSGMENSEMHSKQNTKKQG
jgi:hypothetical protein